jgi:hypothetical protein
MSPRRLFGVAVDGQLLSEHLRNLETVRLFVHASAIRNLSGHPRSCTSDAAESSGS